MRIGVVLPNSPEAGGGGHRIENDLLESLLDRIPDSHHQFTLLGGHPTDPTFSHRSFGNTEHLWLYPPKPLHTRALRKARRLAVGMRHRLLQMQGRPVPYRRSPIEVLLKSHGIQFLLNLNYFSPCLEVPYLVFVWDIEHRRQPYFPELSSNGEWSRREQRFRGLLQRASAIVTGTQAGMEQIELFYQVPSERILVLPHPTPTDALSLSRTRQRSPNRQGKRLTLLYPAQFWAHKNHIGLLKAMRLLREHYGLRPLVRFTGTDFGNQGYVETRAEDLGLANQVEFLGFIPRTNLLDLYLQSDALVYPTTFGPENLPPLEAFALECPVVASRIPGASEQLGDAAILVDPHDHVGLANAIRRVLTDEALRISLTARGRERAQRWTSIDVVNGLLAWLDGFEAVRDLWP